MRIPLSRSALGECNAIKGRGFGQSELTFVLSLNTLFDISHKPVSGYFRLADDSGVNSDRLISLSDPTVLLNRRTWIEILPANVRCQRCEERHLSDKFCP